MKRILIIEDSLRDFHGHWFEQLSCIYHEAKNKNLEINIACHKNVLSTISSQIDCKPIFKRSYFLELSTQSGIKIINYLRFYISSVLALRSLLKSEKKYDFIFIPTCTIHHAIYLLIIKKLGFFKKSTTVPLFLNLPGVWNSGRRTMEYSKNAVIFKLINRLLSKSGGVYLAVQTIIAKEELEKLTGCTYIVLPQPIKLDKSEIIFDNSSSSISFGSFGAERHEKGTDLILKAAEILIKKNPEVNFKIQWINGYFNEEGKMISIPSILNKNPQVCIFTEPLSNKIYNQELSSTHCLILPYRNSSYYFRDSRVALEAAIRGIPIIYTKGGWLERFSKSYDSGIGFEENDIKSLIEAIKKMQKNYFTYKKQAEAVKSQVVLDYSTESFLSKLIDIK